MKKLWSSRNSTKKTHFVFRLSDRYGQIFIYSHNKLTGLLWRWPWAVELVGCSSIFLVVDDNNGIRDGC